MRVIAASECAGQVRFEVAELSAPLNFSAASSDGGGAAASHYGAQLRDIDPRTGLAVCALAIAASPRAAFLALADAAVATHGHVTAFHHAHLIAAHQSGCGLRGADLFGLSMPFVACRIEHLPGAIRASPAYRFVYRHDTNVKKKIEKIFIT